MPRISDITAVLERYAPPALQEGYDNCGLQAGDAGAECTGVLLAVDATERVIDEAVDQGCNLVVTHHPLLFKGLKHVTGATPAERTLIAALRADVAVYSLHTSLDKIPDGGISHVMARKLGLRNVATLCPEHQDYGLGAIGDLAAPLSPYGLVERVKRTLGSPVARCNMFNPNATISKVALCGGSGSSLATEAAALGADAYITSDTGYHTFTDYAGDLFIVDIGHFESEQCCKEIFYRVITEIFSNFAVKYSNVESNPIIYL